METSESLSFAGPSEPPKPPRPVRVRKKKLTRCQKCYRFFYNSEDKTCMNKTGKNCRPTILPTLHSAVVGIIYFSGEEDESKYVEKITDFFKVQERKCDKITQCPFTKQSYGPCGKSDYGYSEMKPCVYIKLNVIEDFIPKSFKRQKDIPTNLSYTALEEIELERQTIWVNCQGETSYDNELIKKIKYYPERSFNEEFFPIDMKGQVNPFVAVRLENVTLNRVISVRCTLIGRNIDPSVSSVPFMVFLGTE